MPYRGPTSTGRKGEDGGESKGRGNLLVLVLVVDERGSFSAIDAHIFPCLVQTGGRERKGGKGREEGKKGRERKGGKGRAGEWPDPSPQYFVLEPSLRARTVIM